MTGMRGGAAGRGQSLAALGLIPPWLGVLFAVVFAAVLVAHLRHIWRNCPASRRCWHWAHVLMAAAMIAMYLPGSLDPLVVPAAAWRAVFILALGVLAVGGVNEWFERRAVSGLWLLVAGDLVAMLYMWSPGVLTVPLSVGLGGFLALEAGVWGSDRVLTLDRPLGPSPYALGGAGAGFGAGAGGLLLGGASATGSGSLGATRELRVAMVAMSLGMGYMILAMALAA
jgi:hypothetical protein